LKNLHIHLALLLLLCPINTCDAWDITGNDDQDFWQRLDKSNRVLDDQQRARKRQEEEVKKIDQDERDQQEQLRSRNRPLFQSDGDLQTRLGDTDDEKDSDSNSITGFKRNQDKIPRDNSDFLKARLRASGEDNYPNSSAKDQKDHQSQTDEQHRLADKLEWRGLIEAQDQLDDWVPSKPDPVDNGGFSIYPDNGSPVPYKLNGHIDIQRKLPWQAEN
jgi:hypothetical protein